jgi:hypothetical protein
MLLLLTILLWWRSAISHHSVLLIFHRSLLLRLSVLRYQRCVKPEPTAKYSWWNIKENNEFVLQKFCWGNSEKENQTATKSKTNRLASNALLGLSERQKRGFAGIQLRLTLYKIRTQTCLFLSMMIRRKKRNKTPIVCSVLVVSLQTRLQKSGYDVRNISDGRTHSVCEPCHGETLLF